MGSNNADGLYIKGVRNIFTDIYSVHNQFTGISLGDASGENIFQNILLANNGGSGFFHSAASPKSTFSLVTSINNRSTGFSLGGSNEVTLHNVLAQNNSSGDLLIQSASYPTFSQLGADDLLFISVNNGKLTGLLSSSGLPNCSVLFGTNPGLVDATCAQNGLSDFNRVSGVGAFALRGQINSDDAQNSSDTNGIAAFTSITDWLRFENPYRAWGKGGSFPSAATQGNCTSGNCQIWDFRLDASDMRFRNTTIDGTNQNLPFTFTGGACPADIGGNATVSSAGPSAKTYLRVAVEIIGTGGNNNGLCESNETCLYTPNFGAYQGEGDYTKKWCTIDASGVVKNVKLFSY